MCFLFLKWSVPLKHSDVSRIFGQKFTPMDRRCRQAVTSSFRSDRFPLFGKKTHRGGPRSLTAVPVGVSGPQLSVVDHCNLRAQPDGRTVDGLSDKSGDHGMMRVIME